LAGQNTPKNAIAHPKEIIDYSEMNDKTFDIDMNMCDTARNVIALISFHLFHGHRYSTMQI
jgi:hypothetical protein